MTQTNNRYVMGIDWGMGHHDTGCLATIDTSTGEMIDLRYWNGYAWEAQRGGLREACAKWPPFVILAEANSIGVVQIEALQMEGLPVRSFIATRISVQRLMEHFMTLLDAGKITLPPDDNLTAQVNLLRQTLDSGAPATHSYLRKSALMAAALATLAGALNGIRLDFA